MRTTQFQLAQIKPLDKTIQFSRISESTRKNVLRLLNQTRFQVSEQRNENKYCFIYINPHSDFAFFWHLLFILVFYIIQLQISLSLGFGPRFFEEQLSLQSAYLPIYVTIIFFLFVDVFISFFKGYYAFGRGRIIDEFRKIVVNYLKTQLYFDLIVIFVYIIPLIHQDYALNYLQLIPGALIWIKKFKYQSQIIDYLQYQAGARAAFMLVILFIDVLMIGNYGACIFVGMDLLLWRIQYYGNDTSLYWLSNNTSYPNNLMDQGPWYYQYIYGQEFSTGTLSTLAPGPFAKNPWEAFYAIIVMIFFMVLASYVGEVLIQIVYTYTERRVFHEENIISFDNFMQLKAVSRSIRDRIYNFFQLIWQVELKMQSKEQEAMIEKLPTYLKEQLLLQIGFTKYIYFLRYLPNQHVLQKMISLKIERVTVDSNTCIFESNKTLSIGQRNLYYIKEGMAKFYLTEREENKNEAELYILKRVKHEKILNLSNTEKLIGVYQFLTGQDYKVCCKSIDLSLVQKLSFDSFIEIINELDIHEEYQWLKYRVLIERDMKLINKICVVCLENHMESQCPNLYPSVLIRQEFADLHKYSTAQGRQEKKRRGLRSGKVRVSLQKLREKQPLNLFSMFPNINIGQLIIDINKLSGQVESEVDGVYNFNSFYREMNALQEGHEMN